MTIGEKIKKLRLSKNLTQTELANLVNVNQKFISAIELDKKKPSYSMIEKLASEFGIEVSELLDNKEEKDEAINSFTIDILNRLVEEGLIEDANTINAIELEMILSAIKMDIKRIQKQKGKI